MITAVSPTTDRDRDTSECMGCAGAKGAPIATLVDIGPALISDSETAQALASHKRAFFALCEICGRDLANAVGFMCVKDGGWSKLEPRRKGK